MQDCRYVGHDSFAGLVSISTARNPRLVFHASQSSLKANSKWLLQAMPGAGVLVSSVFLQRGHTALPDLPHCVGNIEKKNFATRTCRGSIRHLPGRQHSQVKLGRAPIEFLLRVDTPISYLGSMVPSESGVLGMEMASCGSHPWIEGFKTALHW